MTGWGFEPILDSYAAVLLLAALLIGLLLAVRPFASRINRRRRIWLLALRAAVIACVLLAMLRPTRVSQETKPQSATLLVLYDQSRSMTVQDMPGGKSRWQHLVTTLQDSQTALEQMQDLFEVRMYGFAAELENEGYQDGKLTLPTKPDGQQTDIALALGEMLRRESGKRIAGVVLMTDGAQRVYQPRYDIQQTVRELTRMNAPLFTVPFGKPRDESQSRDVAVERLQDQYTVFVKNELEVRGAIRVQGYVNRPIPVRMVIKGPEGVAEQALGPLSLAASQDDQLVDFAFQFTPDVPGNYELRVEAEPRDGELVTSNNQLTAYVNVLDGGLRVLYLEGNFIGGEQAMIRRSLAASPDIELDYRPIDPRLRDQWPIDLSSVWQENTYDVILIGDVDAAALGTENLQQIASAVERGRGLMMTGGLNTLAPGGYDGTPLETVLPIDFPRFSRQTFGPDEPVRQELHREGPIRLVPTRPHFTTHLGGAADSRAAWMRLPPLTGANRIDPQNLRPQAIRLADTDAGDPLLVARQFDRGRVLVFAADSTHLWWRGGFEDDHKRFWRQAMLWLANKDELMRRDVWVRLPRRRFRPGETIAVQAGARADNGDVLEQAEMSARLLREGMEPRPISLVRSDEDWSAEVEELAEAGDYTVEVTAKLEGEPIGEATARFQVQELDLELADPAANPQQLSVLAAMTESAGGRAIPAEQLPDLFRQLREKPPEMEIEVEQKWRFGDSRFDSSLFLLVFVSLLTAEWFLRKKWGLT
jgi:uncharacterized membrane protein